MESQENEHSHLTSKERHLLIQGNKLFKAGEYDLALKYYERGLEQNSKSEEFQLACFLANDEIRKQEKKTKFKKSEEVKDQEKTLSKKKDTITVDFAPIPLSSNQTDIKTKESKKTSSVVDQSKRGLSREVQLQKKLDFLLKRGNALYKANDYEGAKQYFQTGLSLRPDSEELQFALFLAEEKLKKPVIKTTSASKNEHVLDSSANSMREEDTTSRTSTAMEMVRSFGAKHRLIRKHADTAYKLGEFDTALALYDKGQHLLPESGIFKEGKDKTYEAILVATGKKSPGPELLQKLVILEIVKAQQYKDYNGCIEQSKHIITRVTELNVDKIEGKNELMTSCFSLIGNCYFELGDMGKALVYHMKDVELSAELDVDEAKVRGLANVGRVYAKQKDYDNAIMVWTEKLNLPVKQDDAEQAWLFHEIGYCYLEKKDYAQAAEFAQFSLDKAEKAGNKRRMIDAAVLLGQAEMQQLRPEESRESFERAMNIAREHGDISTVQKLEPLLMELREVVRNLDRQKYGAELDAYGPEF